VEVGLTTPGLVDEYDLTSNLNVARKNVGRLKTLIHKYLIKRIPYLALTQGEFFQIASRDNFLIKIQTPTFTDRFDYIDWEILTGAKGKGFSYYDLYSGSASYRVMVAKEHPSMRWVPRYVRYMNYLARKYSVPIFLAEKFDIVFDHKIGSELYDKSTKIRSTTVIPYSITVDITMAFCTWAPSNVTTYESVMSGQVQDDSYFANPANWVTSSILGLNSNRHSTYRCSIEKLFLHLDKVVRAIGNISRKAFYETSAYSFRSSGDS
jgi:hypothetical protein